MTPGALPWKPARAAAFLALAAMAACASPRAGGPSATLPPAAEDLATSPRQATLARPARSHAVPSRPVPAPPPVAGPAQAAPSPPRAGGETARVPADLARHEAIRGQPFLTRSQLALLLAALPGAPADRGGEVPIMTDILDHPAREAIMHAVQAGYLRPFANHRFKPEGLLARAELAEVLCLVLDARRGAGREAPAVEVTDVPPTNRYHPHVRRVTALGLMTTDEDGSFRPTGAVSGREGWQALVRLAALLAGRG